MSCTRPDVRRGGVMFAMMGAAVSLGSFPRSLGASRLATPATLNAMVRLRGMFAWPTEDDPLALYTQTSPSQRTVGRALAELLGASDFDDEHLVCIGSGRPVGFPVVEPEAPPEQWAAFEHVDRERGDTLLYVNWVQPPPPAWFD